MRRTTPLLTSGLLLGTLALGACGDHAERLPASALQSPSEATEPWDTIPPKRLYGATPAQILQMTPVELDLAGIPAGWEGMRVAVLSDLQLGSWRENPAVAAEAVQHAVAAKPDLIVLLGDYLGTGTDLSTLAGVLAPLRGHPALAVLSDADVRNDTLAAAITRTLSDAGVRVLRNEAVPFAHGGDTAYVVGVNPEMSDKTWADKQYLLAQLPHASEAGLLLVHKPQTAAAAPPGLYPGVLAGNTFCGSVEVPGSPRLSWLANEALPGLLAPGTERLFRIGKSVMFVTCGLGYGFVPVRFGAPPEVAMVTLHAAGAPRPKTATAAPKDTLSVDSLIHTFQRRDTTASTDSAD